MKTFYNTSKRAAGQLTGSKLFTLSLLFCGLNYSSFGQVATSTSLDMNNVNAQVSDVGIFFNNISGQSAGYEVPQGSGKNAIYTGSNWFGGYDINGQLKLAAASFFPSGQDLWPGALDTATASYVNPNPLGGTIWRVNASEIEYHVLNYNSPGYTPSLNIANWPAHGDTAVGQAYYLAPFVDVNQNGKYEPLAGDYPCIKGDAAVFTIINDMGNVHASGGLPLGIELHYMFYQYLTSDALNDITFVDVKMINRSTQSLFDFRAGFFLDADLGNYADDFGGSDSTRNLVYFYNSDGNDENNSGMPGYGATPPAIGLACLSHDASSIGFFSNGAPYPYTDPSIPGEYYSVLDGKYLDGTSWLDNLGNPTSFQYSSDPNNAAGWSEETAGNVGNDRRGILSISLDVLQPGQVTEISYAVVFAQGADRLSSVTELLAEVDEVQTRYNNNEFEGCVGSAASLTENTSPTIAIYPNPNGGIFNIDLSNISENCIVQLVDMSGRIIAEEAFGPGHVESFVTTAQAGVYVVKVVSGRGDITQRVVIE